MNGDASDHDSLTSAQILNENERNYVSDSDPELIEDQPQDIGNRRHQPTAEQRRLIWEWLLLKTKPGQPGNLIHGAYADAGRHFKLSRHTIERLWKRGQESLKAGSLVGILSTRHTGRVGRKKIEIDTELIRNIPKRQRRTIRALAFKAGMSKSTMHARVQEGAMRRHTSTMKPFLTDRNKIERLRFCLFMINPYSTISGEYFFNDMMNVIHMDEKWFNITETTAGFYLLPQEEDPHRTAKSKRFITKVMFVAVVARPRHNSSKNSWFDGKIGIFPFTYEQAAKRNSKNRIKGTMETKIVQAIGRSECRAMLIDKILPAIRDKLPRSWPGQTSDTILLQEDNAKPHTLEGDPDVALELVKDGFDMRMKRQPPNSPDFNVLDLGFFRAIQSLQHQQEQNGIDGLIAATTKSFTELESFKLNNVFLSWQQCMIECMTVKGGNNYKVPHMGKEKLERKGLLPLNLKVPMNLHALTVSKVINAPDESS